MINLYFYLPGLLELLLPGLPLGLLVLRVGQPRPRLRQHLQLVLVHVGRVGPRRLRLGIRVDLARLQLPRVVRGGRRVDISFLL